jgi:hypothetical protein
MQSFMVDQNTVRRRGAGREHRDELHHHDACHYGDGRIFEVDRAGKVRWEYVVPYFSAYHDKEAARIFPDATNAIFRAYRYTPDEVPWLSAT